MPVFKEFCAALADLSFEKVPAPVRAQVGLVLADTLGALVAGTRESDVAASRKTNVRSETGIVAA